MLFETRQSRKNIIHSNPPPAAVFVLSCVFSCLSRFQRPQSVTAKMIDQYLGGLPVHCWSEVMAEAKLSPLGFEDAKLSAAEFTRTMEVS